MYKILIAFRLQQLLRERTTFLRSTQNACRVYLQLLRTETNLLLPVMKGEGVKFHMTDLQYCRKFRIL
jgi:hypothetical protein